MNLCFAQSTETGVNSGCCKIFNLKACVYIGIDVVSESLDIATRLDQSECLPHDTELANT